MACVGLCHPISEGLQIGRHLHIVALKIFGTMIFFSETNVSIKNVFVTLRAGFVVVAVAFIFPLASAVQFVYEST